VLTDESENQRPTDVEYLCLRQPLSQDVGRDTFKVVGEDSMA